MTPSHLHTFEARVGDALRSLFPAGQAIRAMVAVSAGPDSTALLSALAALAQQLPLALHAFHVDHGTRGGESRLDRLAAESLARRLDVPFSWTALPPISMPDPSEEYLREKRFEAIEAEAARLEIDNVFLAHHADDLAETLLMRLARGAGLDGLAAFGPSEWRGRLRLLRPLLEFGRQEILDYLRARALEYREDSSNRDDRFFRNRIRRHVLPVFEDQSYPGARKAIARAARLLKTDADYLASAALAALPQSARFFGAAGGALDLKALFRLHPAIRRRILRLVCQRLAQSAAPPQERHIMDIERFAQSGRTGQWFAAWKNLAAYRESGCLRIARPLAGRRLTDSAVCQALRSQSLMDPLFETAVPLPVLGLGAELRDRGLTSIPLEQTCGELGAIQWRIGPMDSFPNGANKGRRHAATCALTLPPSVEVPPCIRLARAEDGIERGGKKILVLQYLAQAGVPRYWREAIPLVSQGSEMVWAPGLESADEAKAIASAPGERMIALEIAWRDAAQ